MSRYDALEDYINDYCVDLFVELVSDRVKYAEAYKADYKKRYAKHPSLIKQYIKSFDDDIKNLAKKCGVKVEELNEEVISSPNVNKYSGELLVSSNSTPIEIMSGRTFGVRSYIKL